jgi:hypothetical protein
MSERLLLCKSINECDKPGNCEHAKPHRRGYTCSHYCNEKRAITECRVVKVDG